MNCIMDELNKKMSEYVETLDLEILSEVINVTNIDFRRIRDEMIEIGRILEEDESKQLYVAEIFAGIANKNVAIVVIKLVNDKIYCMAYAKEGLINQHTASKAIRKIKIKLQEFLYV